MDASAMDSAIGDDGAHVGDDTSHIGSIADVRRESASDSSYPHADSRASTVTLNRGRTTDEQPSDVPVPPPQGSDHSSSRDDAEQPVGGRQYVIARLRELLDTMITHKAAIESLESTVRARSWTFKPAHWVLPRTTWMGYKY